MVDFVISAEHKAALQNATIAFADTGPNPSRIEFYSSTDLLLATVILTKPCGTVAGGYVRLTQQSASGDMIAADGVAVRAQWVSGSEMLVASGPVTDETGDGPFVLEGAAGTQLYAGGRAILGVTEID